MLARCARYPAATDRTLHHLPELTSPSTQRLIDSNSNAHRLKFKCPSTQIQMPIDSNSNAHRLKFKCSSTQIQRLIDSNSKAHRLKCPKTRRPRAKRCAKALAKMHAILFASETHRQIILSLGRSHRDKEHICLVFRAPARCRTQIEPVSVVCDEPVLSQLLYLIGEQISRELRRLLELNRMRPNPRHRH